MKTLIEVALQTLLAFFSILFITRILGRQQMAQLTVFEYINGITFGSIAATLATDLGQKSWPHFVGLVLFGALTYLMSHISLKNRNAAKIIQGEPVLVIQDGRILEKNLERFCYTIDDLTHLLRKKDVFNIADVKYAILETTGEISVVKVAQKENIKVEDLHLSVNQEELNTDIIVTGNIIYENLKKRNLSVKWLLEQLKMMGVKDIKDIYYAAVDKNNKIYIDYVSDSLQKPADITEGKKS
ncbi:YetF domain-containing protein [Fonticella tunisiensis]|uniref:Uncharacterized membrane protein YcaP (DUF421 family) n=1 Tax=Fonticella tunisiensis TaxID=1096341 RepID=A0A4R7KAD7_9CLOT|nr:DUF421 domain-containing protein [Fonticella tunisiensis]TDT51335.1 uncharacterized membrane protein YcaP (DUF421 family) [Fonticella tunisiensis]